MDVLWNGSFQWCPMKGYSITSTDSDQCRQHQMVVIQDCFQVIQNHEWAVLFQVWKDQLSPEGNWANGCQWMTVNIVAHQLWRCLGLMPFCGPIEWLVSWLIKTTHVNHVSLVCRLSWGGLLQLCISGFVDTIDEEQRSTEESWYVQ